MRFPYSYIPFVLDFEGNNPICISPHERFGNLPRLRDYARSVSATFTSESQQVYFLRVRMGSPKIDLLRFNSDMRVEPCPIASAIAWFLVSCLRHGYPDVLSE